MTAREADPIPDPLVFASDALTARGALVEQLEDRGLALLPPALSRELGVPETCTFAGDLGHAPDDAVSCAIGSPLLARLSESLRANVPFAALASGAAAPRESQARSLAERLPLRNAISEVTGTAVAETHYLVAWFAWRAEADDRYDGMFSLALRAGDGSEPDAGLMTLIDPLGPMRGLTLGLLAPPPPSRPILDLLARRATRAAHLATVSARGSVARRHERDHRRIDEYFTTLARDAKSPKRRVEAAVIAQKLGQLARERDAKLHDLSARYALRVSFEPVALVSLTLPAVRVSLHVRRRKREGELIVHLPATASKLDRLTCAACGGPTARPALCDDALHLLCEDCVPQAQGRPECGGCRAPVRIGP
jgi:hypothetical protein